MPTFIKTGFWEKLSKAPKEYLNLDNLIQSIGGGGTSYKKYVALLSQEETNAPVATVLENTLGFDIVWYYESEGFYLFQNNLTGVLFDRTKTWINTPADHTWSNNETPGMYWDSQTPVNFIGIIAPDGDGTLNNYSIEIRVYP
jgi:hypothetical protein